MKNNNSIIIIMAAYIYLYLAQRRMINFYFKIIKIIDIIMVNNIFRLTWYGGQKARPDSYSHLHIPNPRLTYYTFGDPLIDLRNN